MAIQSNYDWEPAPAGGSSWVRPWMLLAVIVSFSVHFGLYTWFERIVIPVDESPTRSAIKSLKDFKVRGMINEEPKREEPVSLDEAHKASIGEVSAQEILKQAGDPYEVPESGIRLRPGEEETPLPGIEATLKGSEITSLLEQDAAQMREELNRLNRASLTETPIASPDQLVIGIGKRDENLIDEETLLKNYRETLAKLSRAGDVGPGKFSDLDQLLGRVGPILDQTKPILMPTDLLFAYNEESLHQGARLSLMKLGLLIQKNPRSVFIIEGHTDSTGPEDYNMELSLLRALSVRNWLVENLSIAPDSLKVRAFGETKPLTDPKGNKEEQAMNRRVEIVILPPSN